MVSFDQDANDAVFLKQSFGHMKSYESSAGPQETDFEKIEYSQIKKRNDEVTTGLRNRPSPKRATMSVRDLG